MAKTPKPAKSAGKATAPGQMAKTGTGTAKSYAPGQVRKPKR